MRAFHAYAGIMRTVHTWQMSRAAVEGYTGEGEPPCIVMTLRAVSDETTPPDLSLPITLTAWPWSERTCKARD